MFINIDTFYPHSQPKQRAPSLSHSTCGGCHSVEYISPNHSSTAMVSRHQVSSVSVATPLSPPSGQDSYPPKPKKLRMCTSSLDIPSEVHMHTCTCSSAVWLLST